MASNDKTITIYGKKRTFRAINGKYYEVKNGEVSKNPSTSFLVTSNLPKLQKSSSTKPMGFMTEKPSGTVKNPKDKNDGNAKAYRPGTVPSKPTPKPKPPAPKAKAVPKARPSGMADRKSKPSVSPTPKPPVPKAKPKPKTDGNAQAYRPGRGDSKLPPKTKDAKNPDAAYKSARDKQRRAGKKIQELSNKTVRDTSIKDARPARGPAYDTKAPAKQKPNARALKQIQERKDKAKNPLSKGMLNKITKELKEGGKPVYKDGIVVGVTHKGLIGTVYTGRPDSNPFKKKKKKK